MSDLVSLLAGARRVLVFTGAGISTGSGIPDFRGPQGVWKRRAPVYFQEFLASEAKRVEYWEYKAEAWAQFRDAAPNATHRAIARLEEVGRGGVVGPGRRTAAPQAVLVVTQNIDGLHQAAGSDPDRVIELHGTNRQVECVTCGERDDPAAAVDEFLRTRATPRCACGGWKKFATISFGQALDPAVLDRAFAEASQADLVLALGSTLSVYPAAQVPLVARRAGAPYVIVNQGPTDHDALATLRIEGDVAEVLPVAVASLLAE